MPTGSSFDNEVTIPTGVGNEQEVEVATSSAVDSPSYAEVMNGAVVSSFFGPETKRKWEADGRDGQGQPVPACGNVKPVEWDHDEVLPLPSPLEMELIRKERDSSPHDASPMEFGPVTRRWYSKVRVWLTRMREKYQPDRKHVTGSWRKNWRAWERRLRKLSEKRRKRVLQLLLQGVELPFDEMPPGPIRTLDNHKQLGERSDVVWKTIREMLDEGSVVAHNCQGRDDVEVLPQGMFAIRWVRKGDTDKVRITVNMRPLNAYLLAECSTVELETLSRITSLWQRGDEQCSLDMHSSYYHLELCAEASQWCGFSVADNELPQGVVTADGLTAVEVLAKLFPCCRWRDRWVFRFRGMPMGASPSAARYCECSDALLECWKGNTVGRAVGLSPEPVRATGYIDDSLFLVQAFARGIEMGLRVVLEFLICGFWVNFDKSVIVPSRKPRYLGCLTDSTLLRLSLPTARCTKVRRAAVTLRENISKAGYVDMRALAKFIGNLWAIHVVARRAVSIMCRSMIAILAKVLRQPWLRNEPDPSRLRWLLKRAWGGFARWTEQAEMELRFWERARYEELWAPMRQWDLVPDARDCLFNPGSGRLETGVQIFAADTSDSASGGAEFAVSAGVLESVSDTPMVTMLSDDVVDESSTLRELQGLCDLFLAFVRKNCRRCFFLVDNLAAMRIVLKGSPIEKLNFFAKLLFLWSLKALMILCPLWMRRNTDMIIEVDGSSRLTVLADYAIPMHLFWRANKMAQTLWGLGFQFDRFASCRTVMPMDGCFKLPFNSQFMQPGSSGANALSQDWRGCVNWVNAPFYLLDQVMGLLKCQQAVGAVVVPRGTRSRWDFEATKGCKGFCAKLTFNPRATHNQMVGQGPNSFKGLYEIVFVDFRAPSYGGFCGLKPAEKLRSLVNTAVKGGGGSVVFSRLSSPLNELYSAVDLVPSVTALHR